MGRVVDDERKKQAAIEAIRNKYGWQMTLVDIGARLGGSKKNWAVIAIRLAAHE
jgi:hypothetical protein